MLFRYIAIHSIMGFSDRLDWVREEDKKKQLYPVWVFFCRWFNSKNEWEIERRREREKKASIAPWRFSFLFFSFLFLGFGQKNWPFNAFISIYTRHISIFNQFFFIPYFTLSNNPQHGADDDDDDFQIQVFT